MSALQTASPEGAVTLASGEFESFGIESVGAEESTTAAGAHANFTARFSMNHFFDVSGVAKAHGRVEDVSVTLPPGFVGYPAAFPRCKTGDLIAGNCPRDSQVGFSRFLIENFTEELGSPIYNLEPVHPDREVARFGFIGVIYPVFLDIKVRTAGDYGVTATVHSAPGAAPLLTTTATLWGNPGDPAHDAERYPPGLSRPTSHCLHDQPLHLPGRRSGLLGHQLSASGSGFQRLGSTGADQQLSGPTLLPQLRS